MNGNVFYCFYNYCLNRQITKELKITRYICTVRPLKIAVLLLSGHTLLNQCLLHLHPTHMTDLPMYLPQAPASDCSYQKGHEGRAHLLVSLITNEST